MSQTELEARQWQAALDFVWMKRDDIALRIKVSEDGWVLVKLTKQSWGEDAAWSALLEPGDKTCEIRLRCTTVEWVEMLAQGSK